MADITIIYTTAVAGPEIARVITEFEAGMHTRKNAILKHHDPITSVQQRFFFRTHQGTGHSIVLLTRIVTKSSLSTPENMRHHVVRSIVGAHGEGNKQHADFVAHRLQSTAVAFQAPIKMNKIHLPGNRHKYRNKSKHVNSTKED